MNVTLWIGAVALLGVSIPGGALADHSHHHDATALAASGSELSATLGLVAASYRTTSFSGDYQGVTPAVHWASGRFAAATSIGAYRLRKNGALYHGVGDLFVQGQVTVISRTTQSFAGGDLVIHRVHHRRPVTRFSAQPEGLLAGLALAVSSPTGSPRHGLGMGHFMVMSSLWGSWTAGEVTLSTSGGVGAAIAESGESGHVHGSGPIVDPMNLSELTWSASGDLAVARDLRLGARLGGALAVDDSGVNRTIGAARAVWTAGRVDTSAEVQVGITGDPFSVRGVVETSLRF